jgi:hypothetical protein
MDTEYLRRRQAGEYLKSKWGVFCANTLATLAVRGGGPRFRKLGRYPVYETAELDRWAASRLSAPVNNTAEARAANAA